MRDLSGISTLLNSLNTNSSTSSINLTDYALIKNGSYQKLMKAYYAEDSSDDSTSSTSSAASSITDSTGLTKMKSEADTLKSAAENLSSDDLWEQTSGEYDTDSIVSAVKTFVSDYNDVVSQSSNVTSSNVTKNVNWMTSLSSTMQNSLSNIGITIGTDNKLTLDEDKLTSADMSSVKELFSGSYSYGGQIGEMAGNISSSALMSTSTYSSDGTASSILSSMFSTEA